MVGDSQARGGLLLAYLKSSDEWRLMLLIPLQTAAAVALQAEKLKFTGKKLSLFTQEVDQLLETLLCGTSGPFPWRRIEIYS